MSPLSPLYHLFVVMQDVTFHQCVNLGKFNTEKVVSFVPPDGEFELMKYRCQEGIKQPFKVCTPRRPLDKLPYHWHPTVVTKCVTADRLGLPGRGVLGHSAASLAVSDDRFLQLQPLFKCACCLLRKVQCPLHPCPRRVLKSHCEWSRHTDCRHAQPGRTIGWTMTRTLCSPILLAPAQLEFCCLLGLHWLAKGFWACTCL